MRSRRSTEGGVGEEVEGGGAGPSGSHHDLPVNVWHPRGGNRPDEPPARRMPTSQVPIEPCVECAQAFQARHTCAGCGWFLCALCTLGHRDVCRWCSEEWTLPNQEELWIRQRDIALANTDFAACTEPEMVRSIRRVALQRAQPTLAASAAHQAPTGSAVPAPQPTGKRTLTHPPRATPSEAAAEDMPPPARRQRTAAGKHVLFLCFFLLGLSLCCVLCLLFACCLLLLLAVVVIVLVGCRSCSSNQEVDNLSVSQLANRYLVWCMVRGAWCIDGAQYDGAGCLAYGASVGVGPGASASAGTSPDAGASSVRCRCRYMCMVVHGAWCMVVRVGGWRVQRPECRVQGAWCMVQVQV